MVLVLIMAIVALSIAIDTIRLGISPMPSSKKARKAFLALVENRTVYELGCGWGTLAVALSRNNSVRAFEKAFIPWLVSWIQQSVRGAKKLSVERKDFFSENLSNADVVICYLYPAAMQRLELKFEKELKRGAVVLSNSFQLPGRKPDQIFEVQDWMRSKIYCYRFAR
jgi:hypothetical protein